MRIGNYDLYPIETGRFALDGGAMFGIVPKPLWERTNPADDRNRVDMAARALLIVGNGRTILVDNGNGTKFTDKQKDIYRLDYTRFTLHSSLQQYGLTVRDITDVILTHLHFDHAGGSVINEGGILMPAFPKAKYYVQKAHWQHAINPTERDLGSFMPDDFLPLQKFGVLEFVDGECEIFPQISLLVMNGHTTAQQLPMISDGTASMLYCCDLIPMTAHIPLPYIMSYDLRPLTTLEEKKRILKRAVDGEWIMYFEHDPTIAAGTIVRTDKGYSLGEAIVFD